MHEFYSRGYPYDFGRATLLLRNIYPKIMAKPTPGNHFSLIFANIIFGWAQHSLTHYRFIVVTAYFLILIGYL
jgi:hypothetical protein